MRRMHAWCAVALLLIVEADPQVRVTAQTITQVTFDEAILRATTNNPAVHQAAAGVLRADSILQQVRARTRPSVDASFGASLAGPITQFAGSSINPRAQTVTTAGVSVPLVTPVGWAQRNQALDQTLVSQRAFSETRLAVAIAAADAYLAVIAQRRVLELSERARDNARAHYDFANQRYEGGVGSRLNAIRSRQELSGNEARVDEARLGVRRAQEALGVLIAVDSPVDAAGDPTFELPPDRDDGLLPTDGSVFGRRPDIQLVIQRQLAAERIVSDGWKDNLPSVTSLFAPQLVAPSGLFAEARSWRASVLMSIPLFDSGRRRGLGAERRALVEMVRTERSNIERQANSEIRTAREAVAATERALQHANTAAAQANEVVQITDVAFREGATTNIEVVDAQRRARDAETATAIAEDAVRRARLEWLVATGRFPQ